MIALTVIIIAAWLWIGYLYNSLHKRMYKNQDEAFQDTLLLSDQCNARINDIENRLEDAKKRIVVAEKVGKELDECMVALHERVTSQEKLNIALIAQMQWLEKEQEGGNDGTNS